jgi:dTDP-4-dehydrorhamnose 3,5-epimerase
VKFIETRLGGAYRVELEPIADERGFFARSFCRREFEARGLAAVWVQSNVSWNERKHTLRGMHYQVPPSAEAKLLRCTAGAIYDVIVDLRRDSPTRFEWVGVELDAERRTLLYVPEGFAHGFLTLCDRCEVFYEMSAPHDPAAARGVRFDDPRLRIAWPAPPAVISERDRALPLLDPGREPGSEA